MKPSLENRGHITYVRLVPSLVKFRFTAGSPTRVKKSSTSVSPSKSGVKASISIAGATLDTWGSNIATVVTDERHRNRGYATSLVSALVERILQTSNLAMICVERSNLAAIRVYTKVGFRPYQKYFAARARKTQKLKGVRTKGVRVIKKCRWRRKWNRLSWQRRERNEEWSLSEDCIRNEWNDAAESWVGFVRAGKDYCREGLNNPAAFEIIGDAAGLTVLDLACGEGYNTRILARKRAKVTGIDFSEKVIEFAMEEEEKEKLGICYKVMNAADLHEFSNHQFDLVTCFMSLQDIQDFDKAISEVARVLKDGGRFVFSIPHPCTEMIRLHKPRGEKIRAIERYFRTMQYTITWDMKRLTKPFKTTSFHRTLSAYFDTLYKSKLVVTRLVEPMPTQKALQKYAGLQDVLEIPQSVVVESVKAGDILPF